MYMYVILCPFFNINLTLNLSLFEGEELMVRRLAGVMKKGEYQSDGQIQNTDAADGEEKRQLPDDKTNDVTTQNVDSPDEEENESHSDPDTMDIVTRKNDNAGKTEKTPETSDIPCKKEIKFP